MSQKSYNGSPTLYVVPTPIGNLDDITFRALSILKSVDVIFSEDTRVTLNLLNKFEIKNHLISSHKFNENESSKKVLEYLSSGKNVAVVSDRGTPGISDPGSLCVKKAIENNFNVVTLPGPTAHVPALVSSGIDSSRFIFYGFLNSKSTHRIKELEKLKLEKMTLIFYESPHRILDMLNDLKNVFGDRFISVSREISKKHEEIYRGNISKVICELGEPKGEFVVVVSGNADEIKFDNLTIEEHIKIYMDDGYSEKDAIKMVAKDRKVPKNYIYKEYKLFPGK